MPIIAELKEIDGAMWARLDIDLNSDEQAVSLWTDSEARKAVKKEAIEVVASWMIAHSYATGPGDSIDDLLQELVGQVIDHPIGSPS